jgi:hypothetical protein
VSAQVFPGRGASSGADATLTGFGELAVAEATPTGATDFIYGLNLSQVFTRQYSSATVVSTDGEVVLSSGTTSGAYGRCALLPNITYHPGQGTLFRGTARFDTPQANTRQLFGMTSLTGGYQFGYVGTTFGILHIDGGAVEVQTLTVTVAPAAPGNVTITLDGGTPVNVPVTASGSTNVAAYEISRGDFSQASGGWTAVSSNNVVYFTRRITGAAGASTFNAGATGAAATFAITVVGSPATETFYPQSEWSIDKAPWLDPSKGNIFQVRFQYLGYGNAFFGVEEPGTGRFTPVHMIVNAGARTRTVMRNPNGFLLWEVQNNGSGTGVTLRGASAASFLDGPERYFGQERSTSATRAITAATETPVLSIRTANVFGGIFSTKQLFPLRLSAAADGTKNVVINVYKAAGLTAAQFIPVNTGSCALKDSAATAVTTTGATLIYSFALSKTGQDTQDLSSFNTFLSLGEVLTITAYSANSSDVTITLAWDED